MKLILVTIALFIALFSFAQDGINLPEFVTVYMPHYTWNHSLHMTDWKAYYSDNTVKDMSRVLGLNPTRMDYKNDSIAVQYEFKMLEYFYGGGYSLISIEQQDPAAPRQFYFKLK